MFHGDHLIVPQTLHQINNFGIWSVCEQVMGINLDGLDLDCLGLDFWYLVCLHLHSFWVTLY